MPFTISQETPTDTLETGAEELRKCFVVLHFDPDANPEINKHELILDVGGPVAIPGEITQAPPNPLYLARQMATEPEFIKTRTSEFRNAISERRVTWRSRSEGCNPDGVLYISSRKTEDDDEEGYTGEIKFIKKNNPPEDPPKKKIVDEPSPFFPPIQKPAIPPQKKSSKTPKTEPGIEIP